MAYDEGLAQRIREEFSDIHGIIEKKMFGGVCYLINGNMACGVYKEYLIVRYYTQYYSKIIILWISHFVYDQLG